MISRSVALYRVPVGMERNDLLQVTGFGIQTIRAQVEDRRLPHHGLVWVERGRGRLWTEASGHHEIVEPSIFWLASGVRHSYGPAPGTAWDERWVLFDGQLARQLENRGLLNRDSPLIGCVNDLEVAQLFTALHSEMSDSDPLAPLAAAATLHRLIVRMGINRNRSLSKGEGNAAAALESLKEFANQDIDISDLAARFNISPATLRRQSIAIYGVPPKVLQTRLRLDSAKHHLSMSDAPIEAIAEQAGYSDPFYFSRIFHKYEGCSPSTFRQRHRRS